MSSIEVLTEIMSKKYIPPPSNAGSNSLSSGSGDGLSSSARQGHSNTASSNSSGSIDMLLSIVTKSVSLLTQYRFHYEHACTYCSIHTNQACLLVQCVLLLGWTVTLMTHPSCWVCWSLWLCSLRVIWSDASTCVTALEVPLLLPVHTRPPPTCLLARLDEVRLYWY